MSKWSFSFFLLFFSYTFSANFIIKNYDINIEITRNNIYKVNETIDAIFLKPSHGIVRVIPTAFNNRNAKISNIKTNTPTSVRKEKKYISLRLGSPDEYVKYEKIYKISFDHNLGYDQDETKDEIYYNIIGNDWDTFISKVKFKIILPENIDKKNIHFTTGKYGSRNSSNIIWKINKNVITGETTEALAPYEAITLAIPLKNNFFSVTSEKIKYYSILAGLSLLALIVPGIGLFFKSKYKDSKTVQTVEFYPPENLTPTELGYYIDGRIDIKDFTSLIFYWANKNYLRILKDFNIEILETSPTFKNEFEKIFYSSLVKFKNKDNIVELDKIKGSFAPYLNSATEDFRLDLALNNKTLYSTKSLNIGRNIKSSVAILVVAGAAFISYDNFRTSAILLILIVSGLITFTIGENIRQKTAFAKKIYGRILGFKHFLKVAEKDKLENLLNENPNYFYDILPYTIALNVSDIWADKFKELAVQAPNWYENDGDFSLRSFSNNIIIGNSRFGNTMCYMPSHSNSNSNYAPRHFGGGSSSSSGGSAGGGAGGGGGSSW